MHFHTINPASPAFALSRWLLLGFALGSTGCAHVSHDHGLVGRGAATPVVVEVPPGRHSAARAPRTTPVARTHAGVGIEPRSTPVSGTRSRPRIRAVQSSPESIDIPPPPTEHPDGYWIVSSRAARCAPSEPESSRDLGFLHRTPRGMTPYPREAFLESLRPDRPVCFVIHGSYNYWPDVLRESERSFRWVRHAANGKGIQFVFFTWPSDGYAHVVFPVELAVMGRRCAIHSVYLANLISRFPTEQPVCIIGHSHGARCAVAALHALGGGAVDDGSRLPSGTPVPAHLRAVLLAAAVDHDWLNPGEQYGQALRPVERMLVVHNRRDGWLNVYPLKNLMGNDAALGSRGLQYQDQMRLNELGRKITLLDASGLAGRSHDFTAFTTRTEFATAIAPFVTFDDEAGPPLMGDPYRQTIPANGFTPPLRTPGVPEGASIGDPGWETSSNRRTRPASSRASSRPPVSRTTTPTRSNTTPSPPAIAPRKPLEEEPLSAPKPRLSIPTERRPRAEIWIEPLEEGVDES